MNVDTRGGKGKSFDQVKDVPKRDTAAETARALVQLFNQ